MLHPPARYEAGRPLPMRRRLSSRPGRGKSVVAYDERSATIALAGGRRRPGPRSRRGPDDGRDLLGHDVLATRGLTLDGVGLALEAALAATDARAPARVRALRRLASAPRRSSAAQLTLAARRERLGDAGATSVTRSRASSDGADVDEHGALGDVAALLGRRLAARVGLGGLARLVLRRGARAATGGLRGDLRAVVARACCAAVARRSRVALAQRRVLRGGAALRRPLRVGGGGLGGASAMVAVSPSVLPG